MSARKEREKKEYFTLGSYTTQKDFRHHTMSLDDADKVRTEALRIAEFRKTKIKFVSGSRLNAK